MPDQLTVVLRLNGVGNAFLRELGCDNCPQCSAVKPRANTSASLIVKRGRRTAGHLLFDCGLGVVDSLINAGLRSVDGVFVSHLHNDHLLGLDTLANCLRRSGAPVPVPVFATRDTWERGILLHFPYLVPGLLMRVNAGEDGAVELPFGFAGEIDLRVTPVPVWHGKIPGESPVIWVIEFGTPDARRKIILGWDLLHLIPRHPSEDHDADYAGPCSREDVLSGPRAELLSRADELFIEGNTRLPCPRSGHTSIEAALRFHVPKLTPARTWVVHYSGHEDPGGPLSDDDLQRWIDREKANHPCVGAVIRVAAHGQLLAFPVAGPGGP